MATENGNNSGTSASAIATIRVGDEFSLTGEGVYSGTSRKGNPYICVLKKAERGFSSVKMFVHNVYECQNAQSIKVTKIIDASCAPKKSPNGKFYSEYKITADCEPKDIYKDERQKTSEEFEMFVNTDDAKPEGGLFDMYSDGNDLPFV